MGTIYSLGSGKMVPIRVDDKNDLPIGTILRLDGYSNPRFVITANFGVNPNFSSSGATYQTVNLDEMTVRQHQAYCLKWNREDNGHNGIQVYITDETMMCFEGMNLRELVAKAQGLEAIRKAEEAAKPKPIYISLTETAKLVRCALKDAYPEIKFSVRSKSYSMGCSISVSWTDGPAQDAIDKILGQFEGAEFDAMQDLKTHHNSIYDGKLVSFGVDYVTGSRHISNWEAKQELAKEAIRCTCQVDTDANGYEKFGGHWIDDLASRVLWTQDYTNGETIIDALNRYLGVA